MERHEHWFGLAGLSQKGNRIVNSVIISIRGFLSVRSFIPSSHLLLQFGLRAVGWILGSQCGATER